LDRRRPAAPCAYRLPSCRAKDGRTRSRRVRAVAAPIRQPAVRSAVRHGAHRQQARQRRRTGVVADAAYATCLRLARQHYENFQVASGLLPKAWRPHVAALYGFARIADDFADEGDRPDEARLSLLDDWRRRLDDAMNGVTPDDGSDSAAVFVALADTVRRFDLDPSLLADLISAFRQDVLVKRYE